MPTGSDGPILQAYGSQAARGHPLDLARRSERDPARPGRGDGPGPHRVRATVLDSVDFDSLDARPHRFDDRATTAPSVCVFGADGAGSQVRESMSAVSGRARPTSTGSTTATRSSPCRPATTAAIRLDPNALHIWPRGEFMLIALANPDRRLHRHALRPEQGPETFAALDDTRTGRAVLRRRVPRLRRAGARSGRRSSSTIPPVALATLRAIGWSHGDQAVVVGDAAHAIVPFHGQGMNAGDGVGPGPRPAPLPTGRTTSPAAFRRFEADRKPDADAIADMALDNYVEMRAGVVDPDYLAEARRWRSSSSGAIPSTSALGTTW